MTLIFKNRNPPNPQTTYSSESGNILTTEVTHIRGSKVTDQNEQIHCHRRQRLTAHIQTAVWRKQVIQSDWQLMGFRENDRQTGGYCRRVNK